jgi:hypothetical protein
MNLELTADERKLLLDSLLERLWQHERSTLEELTLITVPRFAGMVDLSTPQARRVLEETIDFGPQNTRVSLAEARRCIEARRIKKRR